MKLVKDFQNLAEDVLEGFEKMGKLDRSISVPELGSLFKYDTSSWLSKVQEQVKEMYNVKHAWFSTNGTTALNVLSLLSVTNKGDKVLIQRDSHVSVLAAVIQGGLVPVYIKPKYFKEFRINLGVTESQLRKILETERDIKAVFLTYPNYFGIATDINSIASYIKSLGKNLVVDSAHGAYFRYHQELPFPAENSAADIITQSVHKTCGALSQGSLGLFNNSSIIENFYEAVNNLGYISTSFSFPILLSVYLAIYQLYTRGNRLLDKVIELTYWVRNEVSTLKNLRTFYPGDFVQDGFKELDPLRITIDVSSTGLTGFEFEEILIEKYKIYPEMATLHNVLFLFTPFDTEEDARKLIYAIKDIATNSEFVTNKTLPSLYDNFPEIPQQVVNLREAYFSRKRRIPVDEAVGKVSGESIAAYPPGSAVIVAGEIITGEIIDYLKAVKNYGGVLKGASDQNFQTIKVLDL